MTGTGSDAGRTFETIETALDFDYENEQYRDESGYLNPYYYEGYSSSQPLAQDSSLLREQSPNAYAAEQIYNRAAHYVTTVLEELRICRISGK